MATIYVTSKDGIPFTVRVKAVSAAQLAFAKRVEKAFALAHEAAVLDEFSPDYARLFSRGAAA